MAAAMVIEHNRTIEEVRAYAQLLTSGTVPEATIRKLRPFARRAGLNRRRMTSGAVPKLPINAHTGRLRRSMRTVKRGASGRFGVSGSTDLLFTAPYAKWVLGRQGTRKMVPRGFWEELERYSRSRSAQNVKRAARRGLL